LWTNDTWLFDDLGLSGKDIMLWKVWLRTQDMLDQGHINHAHDIQMLQKKPEWKRARKIFLVDTEGFLPDHLPEDDRVHIWDSSVMPHPRVHSYWFWIDWCREIESYMMHGDLCQTSNDRPYMFDIFMGKQKPSRDLAWQLINDRLQGRCIKSYTGQGTDWITGFDIDRIDNISSLQRPQFDFDNPNQAMEGYRATYHDRMTGNVSAFVPWQVYQQSWYTLVTETHQDRLFVTEKSVKPLLGRRLFVMMHACRGHLALLQDLGFKTFGDIIDESYDQIEDFYQRTEAAIEQCNWLGKQDPLKIYSRIKDRLEHNRRTVLEYDGVLIMKKQMEELI